VSNNLVGYVACDFARGAHLIFKRRLFNLHTSFRMSLYQTKLRNKSFVVSVLTFNENSIEYLNISMYIIFLELRVFRW